MSEWIQRAIYGGAIRIVEATISSIPTLLVGLGVAAILRYYLGAAGTRKLFGGDSLRSLPQSWLVGMLLPVCSIGVLPILIEMRRAKLKVGAMSAFALSAPLFNPMSLLYGLTLSRPYVIVMFALGSLFVVTVVGAIWDSLAKRAGDETEEQLAATDAADSVIGIRRLLLVVVYICRQLCGPVGLWSLIAVSGMVLLSAVLPFGSLGTAMERDDWWAPARMALVAVPVYATPMLAMGQLGMMFQHVNSPGAAFILLVIGAGMNLGTLAWMAKSYGLRSVGIWFSCLMLVVVSIAYAINQPLVPVGVQPAGHTHAFDGYSNPILTVDSTTPDFVQRKVSESLQIGAMISLGLLATLLLVGAVCRIVGWDEAAISGKSVTLPAKLGDGFQPGEPASGKPGFDRNVSPQTVGGTLIAGIIALSITMCFAFYPSPNECIKEIRYIRSDAISGVMTGNYADAEFWLPRWDQWSRRMEVGAIIRRGGLTPYQRMQGYILRSKIDLLEHEIEEDHPDKERANQIATELMFTEQRLIDAYRNPYSSDNAIDSSSDP